jgi:HD-like signal output (HDOD) protein
VVARPATPRPTLATTRPAVATSRPALATTRPSLATTRPTPGVLADVDTDPLLTLGLEAASEVDEEVRVVAEEADRRLGERLLEHFAAHRPGPGSFPQVALRILNLVAEAEVDPAELSQLVSRDPAIAAGVVRVASSAAYPQGSPIESVREAINRIGLHEVARVAGTFSAESLFSPKARAEYAAYANLFQQLYQHASTTAMASAALALGHPGTRSDRAFLAALLHDVGCSIALRSFASLALQDPKLKKLDEAATLRAIDRVHTEIGGEVHQAWALPEFSTTICVRHHDKEIPASPEFVELHIVRLASSLRLARLRPAEDARLAEVSQSARALGLTKFQLRSFDAELRQLGLRASSFLRGPTGLTSGMLPAIGAGPGR